MQSNTKCLLPARHGESYMQEGAPAKAAVRIICRNLLLIGVALVFSMTMNGETQASDRPDAGSYGNLDTRWLPWIGSWRLVSNTVNTSEGALNEEYLLTISPGDNGETITMRGYQDETILFEDTIIADGLRHPLSDDECTGWYLYSWSETGKRLLFNSESSCPGDLPQIISGMSIIDDTGDWLDIQLLQSGEEKAITVRRYRNVDNDTVIMGRINASQSLVSRISAGTDFSISEVIELSEKVEPEVLEAALVELHKSFPINSKQLLRLADSNVPSQIIDLMVALSFPDKFTVNRTAVYPVLEAESQENYPYLRSPDQYCSYDHLMFPRHWPSSACMRYDYWHMGYGAWPGWYYYSFWWNSHYGGGGYEIETGRLVEGSGYTRVDPGSSGSTPRYAQPRNAPEGQGAVIRPSSSSSSGTSSSGYSSGSSSGSSSSSKSKSPCASPNGYSSGECDY